MKDLAKITMILLSGIMWAAAPYLPAQNPTSSLQGVLRKKANAGGGAPIAFVQDDSTTFDPFNTARSVSFSSDTTSGNCIIAVYYGGNADQITVTDSNSNTYTELQDGATSFICIHAAYNITGLISFRDVHERNISRERGQHLGF